MIATRGYFNKETCQIKCVDHVDKDDDDYFLIWSHEVVGDTFLCEVCCTCIVCGKFHDHHEDCIWEDE